MTSIRINDPLLAAAKALLLAMQIGLGICIAAAVIALATYLIAPAKLAEAMGPIDPSLAWSLPATLAIGMASLALCFVFVEQLRQIIATVGEGDPFDPQNAVRLNRMAIHAGGLLICQTVLGYLTPLLHRAIPADGGNASIGFSDLDPSFQTLVLAIVLLILSRVFRHGAAMRADLDGTV